ncbi:MOSC and FAD-binding oxidoreductase domain-containing protein [Mucilaginibacter sabulilitoris]|uniref:MOSC and FAD-binding oxidoreductase domain-containing protein n=1 Tax=Mucilaginibacter sabulilitoris TaxID=1173583 RepID=A0ABZ0TEE9_9SPHI|nr:MOSC and FAD-binding oxidoreductase domain-containing protein [Mucilaginibacter sabulilitoris]WPU91577.1 MOSC and FAD-binding oxidoreductase domain-containing protein [Mucilaginibacter sabulilitoris]
MKVVSVNVGQPQEIPWRGQMVRTSVYKTPVAGRVRVRKLNFEGDAQADLIGHGGEHRAVMVYQAESYQYWRDTLQRKDFVYGQFGENLTVEEMADNEVYIGDRFRIGSAIFEITQPRVTCWRVGISTGVPEMPALLVKHRRPGFYFRVIQEGEVGAGEVIEKITDGDQKMSVAEIDGLLYLKDHPEDKLQRALKIPALSQAWQVSFQNLLDAALQGVTKGNAGLSGSTIELSWSGFRPFVVKRVRMECEGVRSFELSTGDGSPVPGFLPGQHIAVKMYPAPDGAPLIRMYSLCGPQDASSLRIAVKLETNGAGGIYMHERVQEGDILEISAPRGTFTLSDGTGPLVLLSAGVGVTPLLSILHYVACRDSGRKLWWIHSCKNKSFEAFSEEVRSLGMQLSAFHRVMIYSSPDDHEHYGLDYDIKGHLDLQQLKAIQLPKESECYLCGPPAYLQNVKAALRSIGISDGKIKSELFGSQPESAAGGGKAPHLPTENTGQGPLVTFSKSKISFRWKPGFGSLLEAAEACDVPVLWSCRMGVCHRCETGIIDGQVTYSPAPLDLPANGNVLLCCSAPAGPVDLDL